jgi:biopolymer transport protein ExbD
MAMEKTSHQKKEDGMVGETWKRKITDDEGGVNLMPFINFLVVLIPVLMLSAEFSQINIIDACPVRGGGTDSLSLERPIPTQLAICISDSAITIAGNERFLASIPCTPRFLPEQQITEALATIRSGLTANRDQITIASDNRVKYQRLIDVMDLARKHGFTDVSIAKLRS